MSVPVGQQTILLLGEDSYNRQLLVDVLCQRGFQVIKARSASEADRALTAQPEVVVVDQRLRGTTGLAWIKRLRESGSTMPVVFCSASNCSPKSFNVLRNILKVSLIVRKPLVPLQLINQIEALLPLCGDGPPATATDSTSPFPASTTTTTTTASDAHDILQFSPPPQSAEETWLKDYDEEQETRKALEELGRAYLKEMTETLYELRAQIASAMVAEDCEQLLLATSTAHQIKGTAGSLGFPELGRLAGEIEAQLKAFKANGKATDRQPMALALILVAEIEVWLEAWQDDNQDFAGDHVAAPALAPTVIELVSDKPAIEALPTKACDQGAPLAFIVDNNAVRVQALANVLRAHDNWQVETVTGGVRVLSALEECQPELLILDGAEDGCGKGLSGFDICRMIRCHPKWALMPILIITADTGINSRRAVYQAGASDFIVTPLVEEELANRLLALFQKRTLGLA